MQVARSKTSWVTEEGGNMQIYLHVSWWYSVLRPFLQPVFLPNSNWRQHGSSLQIWVNTKQSQKWMGNEKVQDISWMPEINCVNIFPSFKRKLLLTSCELVIHLSNWSLQCKATSFPDACCLIHSNTHLYITLAYSLPVQQLELQQASQRARRSKEDGKCLQIKYRWNLIWGVWGLQQLLLLLYTKKQKCSHTHLSGWRIDSLFRHNGAWSSVQWFRSLTRMNGF